MKLRPLGNCDVAEDKLPDCTEAPLKDLKVGIASVTRSGLFGVHTETVFLFRGEVLLLWVR